jgi:hypothetical protein
VLRVSWLTKRRRDICLIDTKLLLEDAACLTAVVPW